MTELDYRGATQATSASYSRDQTELKPFPSAGSTSSSIKTTEPVKDHRRRRSSSIISHVEQETFEDENDQQMLPNMNATWVDQRGAWIIHVVVIILLKLFFNLFPGVTAEWSWTLTNTSYVVGSYVMFHLIKGYTVWFQRWRLWQSDNVGTNRWRNFIYSFKKIFDYRANRPISG